MKGYIEYIVFLPKVFETKKEKIGVKFNCCRLAVSFLFSLQNSDRCDCYDYNGLTVE
jgi:hypothetical protein